MGSRLRQAGNGRCPPDLGRSPNAPARSLWGQNLPLRGAWSTRQLSVGLSRSLGCQGRQVEPQSARRHAQSTVTDRVPYVRFEPLVPAVFMVCEEAIMARGSKVFRPADVSESNASSYLEPFREGQRNRYTRRLRDHAGLKNYGVNLVRVLPGGQSSARHTHSKQDEFVYVIEGEFVLVTDAGRETVGAGHLHRLSSWNGRRPSFPESHAEGCHLPRDRRPDGRR